MTFSYHRMGTVALEYACAEHFFTYGEELVSSGAGIFLFDFSLPGDGPAEDDLPRPLRGLGEELGGRR